MGDYFKNNQSQIHNNPPKGLSKTLEKLAITIHFNDHLLSNGLFGLKVHFRVKTHN